jgi:hypothetical protein
LPHVEYAGTFSIAAAGFIISLTLGIREDRAVGHCYAMPHPLKLLKYGVSHPDLDSSSRND